MNIVKIEGGPITHRYLINKSKDELATMIMRQLGNLEALSTQLLQDHKMMHGLCVCPACRIARSYLS